MSARLPGSSLILNDSGNTYQIIFETAFAFLVVIFLVFLRVGMLTIFYSALTRCRWISLFILWHLRIGNGYLRHWAVFDRVFRNQIYVDLDSEWWTVCQESAG